MFSLWGIASMAVNPVLLQVAGIIINVAFTLPQSICCWNTGVERFMGRDARTENFALEGAAEESTVFGRLSPPEWDHGTAPEQPLGAAAVSADRTGPRVAPSTNTAFYWLYHKGTQMQTYTGTRLPAISKTQISGCEWIPQKLFFFFFPPPSSQCYPQSILDSVGLPPRVSSRLLHNYNHYRRRHFLLQPLDKRNTVSLDFLWMAAETFVSCPSS